MLIDTKEPLPLLSFTISSLLFENCGKLLIKKLKHFACFMFLFMDVKDKLKEPAHTRRFSKLR